MLANYVLVTSLQVACCIINASAIRVSNAALTILMSCNFHISSTSNNMRTCMARSVNRVLGRIEQQLTF